MNAATAIYRDGRLELTSAVDWPHGTPVEVKPLAPAADRESWFAFPPLDVGTFRELSSEDELLGSRFGKMR